MTTYLVPLVTQTKKNKMLLLKSTLFSDISFCISSAITQEHKSVCSRDKYATNITQNGLLQKCTLTFLEVNKTLSKYRSHSKMKTGFLVSGSCFNASSFKIKLWLNSIVTDFNCYKTKFVKQVTVSKSQLATTLYTLILIINYEKLYDTICD